MFLIIFLGRMVKVIVILKFELNVFSFFSICFINISKFIVRFVGDFLKSIGIEVFWRWVNGGFGYTDIVRTVISSVAGVFCFRLGLEVVVTCVVVGFAYGNLRLGFYFSKDGGILVFLMFILYLEN